MESAWAAGVRDVDSYFQLLSRLLGNVRSEDAVNCAAQLLSFRGPHAGRPGVRITSKDGWPALARRFQTSDQAFVHVALFHLYALHLVDAENDYERAYEQYIEMMAVWNREILANRKDTNWFMPVFYAVIADLRRLAFLADKAAAQDGAAAAEVAAAATSSGEAPSTRYEQCAALLMESYRAVVSDGKEAAVSKKVGLLNMTNQLFRIYFRINKLNLLTPLIRAIDNSPQLAPNFSMADRITYNFFLGRKATFDSQLPLAEKSLEFAFEHCPSSCIRNKRAILIYLIPVRMFLGHMPSAHLLQRYDLLQFAPIVEAVKIGDLRVLARALQEYEAFFIECGIFLMLERLKMLAYRTLFKSVARVLEGSQLPLAAFLDAVHWLGETDVDTDELECILANLIAQGKIKGYLAHQHAKLVLSKKNPFPTLSSCA